MSSILTVEDVRQFLWDRSAADNQIENALAFTDDEIRAAMRFAAREFNSIPPIDHAVTGDNLPGDTNMFLDGTAMGLYIGRLSQMGRNQVEYTAGGASVAFEKAQIDFMKQHLPLHTERFKEAARTLKLSCNLRGFFGIHDTIHL